MSSAKSATVRMHAVIEASQKAMASKMHGTRDIFDMSENERVCVREVDG